MNPDTVEMIVCPACSRTELQSLPPPGHWIGSEIFRPLQSSLGLSRCRSCRFIFTNPRPSNEFLYRFYSGATYDCHNADETPVAQNHARFLLTRLGSSGETSSAKRLLDYGCGGGFLLRQALQAGWEALGYDPGQRAIEVCRQQNFPVTGELADLRGQKFDAIVLSHVFEHVADHGELLSFLAGILSPGGKLFIEVPNATSLRSRLSTAFCSRHLGFDERYRAFPIHLSYFTRDTLRRVLRKHGFDCVGVETLGVGLEELRVGNGQGGPAGKPQPQTARSARPSRWKAAIKKVYFAVGFGENILAICQPRHAT